MALTVMQLIEKIKKSPDYQEYTIPLAHLHMEFLIRCFESMRDIAAENFYDTWQFGDLSKERQDAFKKVDQALEERMRGNPKA